MLGWLLLLDCWDGCEELWVVSVLCWLLLVGLLWVCWVGLLLLDCWGGCEELWVVSVRCWLLPVGCWRDCEVLWVVPVFCWPLHVVVVGWYWCIFLGGRWVCALVAVSLGSCVSLATTRGLAIAWCL